MNFDLLDFLPYLLNQAADATSLEFQRYYKSKYGILRTEWRVLFHLGNYGEMTAKEICDRARIHKTKVSRAVSALENRHYISRQENVEDRRHSQLKLTNQGDVVFRDLHKAARQFDAKLRADLKPEEAAILYNTLLKLSGLNR